MPAKRLREEAGYSLVEVLASIIILTVAIIPMVGMFDMGLNLATQGSNYDKARALANLKLEQAKNLPFNTLRDNFPEAVGTTTTYDANGYYQSAWKDPALTEAAPANVDFANFDYQIEKQYMEEPSTAPASSSEPFNTSATVTNLIRVTVTVRWADGTEYTTLGLVGR